MERRASGAECADRSSQLDLLAVVRSGSEPWGWGLRELLTRAWHDLHLLALQDSERHRGRLQWGNLGKSNLGIQRIVEKKKKVFDEGSGNVDLCGGDFVYVRNTGTHGNPMVLRKMKSVRRKIGSRNTKPTTRSLW